MTPLTISRLTHTSPFQVTDSTASVLQRFTSFDELCEYIAYHLDEEDGTFQTKDGLITEIEDLQTKVEGLETSLDLKTEEAEGLVEERDTLVRDFDTLESELRDLQRSFDDQDKELCTLRHDFEALAATLNGTELENAELTHALSTLRTQLALCQPTTSPLPSSPLIVTATAPSTATSKPSSPLSLGTV